jgi:hypothetical protein
MSDIARDLGVSRRTVHKHKNALLKGGYIVLINPGGNPQCFGPGPTPLPVEKEGPSGMVKQRDLEIKLHHIKVYFPVISKPKKDLDDYNWDKKWTGSFSDEHFKKSLGLDKLSGKYSKVKSITYHQGPNKSSLQINLDGVEVPLKDFQQVYTQRWAKAQDIANSFSKQFQCRFGLPTEPEDPHAALPPPPGIDESTLRRAKELNIRTEYASTEGSDGPLEIEIQKLDLLNAYENLPKILDALSEADEDNRKFLTNQAQKANITVASITKITNILAGHQRQLNLLLSLVAGTIQEDEKKEEDPSEGRYIG